MHVGYSGDVSASRVVDLDAFKEWVRKSLQDARARGMVDGDIQTAVNFSANTFHRWQSGRFGPEGPKPETVYKFADGLGLDRRVPARLLGFTGETVTLTPAANLEPDLPEDVRLIVAQLRDPRVPEREKEFLYESLKMLAARYRLRTTGRGSRKE
jgi:hypothetical protein